jgi:agmatinase
MNNNLTFGDIPPEFTRYDQARVVILPVPYEQTTSYLKGTEKGPQAIIKAAEQIELFDEKLKSEPYQMGIHILPFIPTTTNPVVFLNQLEDEVLHHLAKHKLMVMLGGEHTITLGGVKAAKRVFPDLGVVQIDAHADLRNSYQNNPYSHAAVMRRIFDEEVPIFQFGIRSLSREEYEFIKEKKINTLFQHELSKKSLKSFLTQLPENIYLTIDLDGFDPAVVPGVGNPEPGGLSWEVADHILEQISSRSRIRAFDIVELRPLPEEARSEITAARLLYRILGYVARDQKFLRLEA